jgi:serine/threonine protein kinase
MSKTEEVGSLDKDNRLVATVVAGNTFTLDQRYDLSSSRILGKGSFGVVCTAVDKLRGNISIAIKRIRPYANDDWDAKHTLREIRLMKLLGNHPNVRTVSFFFLLMKFRI